MSVSLAKPVLPVLAHYHVTAYSADCDGTYTRTYVLTATPSERASEFPDLVFQARVVGDIVNLDTEFGATLNVQAGGDFSYTEPTDEGMRAYEVERCDAVGCSLDGTYRDHRAESMGY